jgi:hypothetical protein
VTPAKPAAPAATRTKIPTKLVPSPSTPNAEVAAALDAAGTLHVVYTEGTAETEDLYYVTVTGTTVSSPVRITSLGARRVRYANVMVDGDAVHVAFFVVRKPDSSKADNYAVYYARGTSAGFTVEQVSQTSTGKTPSPFNAYVNDRPRVFLDASGQPTVAYLSWNHSSTQGYGTYVDFATRGSGGWTYEEAFKPDPAHSVAEGIAVPHRWQAVRQVAYYDQHDYKPHLMTYDGKHWAEQTVDGPSGYTNLDAVDLDYDAKGVGHLTWVGKKDKVFAHRTVNGTTIGPLEKTSIKRQPWSNFAPTAIDPVDGSLWFLYEDITEDKNRHRVLAPGAAGYREVVVPELGQKTAAIRGHGAFFVQGGTVTLVTAAATLGGIFITRFSP